VILAAGYGTRLLPVTKAQPKEMLPLVDKPVIHYAVEEAVASGIRDIIIVTAIGKRAVEDYFDRSRDIEDLLAEKGDLERLEEIRRISQMADFAYVRQGEPRGLGDAVLKARHLVDEPFVLILPDDVIIGEPPVTQQLMECFGRRGVSVIAVQEVSERETSSYGIVAGEAINDRETRLTRLVEKPPPGEAPSNWANAGTWLFEPGVLDHIPDERMDRSLEQLVFPSVIAEGLRVQGFPSDAYWMDVGTSERYLQLHRDLLEGRIAGLLPAGIATQPLVGEACQVWQDATISGRVILGRGCRVGGLACVQGPSVLGDDCVVRERALVAGSVLWSNVKVGAGAVVRDSILGDGCWVGDDAVVDGAVLANGAKVKQGVRLVPGARLEPDEVAG